MGAKYTEYGFSIAADSVIKSVTSGLQSKRQQSTAHSDSVPVVEPFFARAPAPHGFDDRSIAWSILFVIRPTKMHTPRVQKITVNTMSCRFAAKMIFNS